MTPPSFRLPGFRRSSFRRSWSRRSGLPGPGISRLAPAALAALALAAFACLAAHTRVHAQAETPPAPQAAPPAPAPAGTTITIRMFEARTATAIIPNNLLVRVDHQDEVRNQTLHIDDLGVGTVTLPADATVLSVQGTYNDGMEIFLNCDAGMEKNASAIHWYSVATIVSTGVIAPNECFKGKFERNPRVPLKPGEFDFFVRKISVKDQLLD
jgi:hypothetical protein